MEDYIVQNEVLQENNQMVSQITDENTEERDGEEEREETEEDREGTEEIDTDIASSENLENGNDDDSPPPSGGQNLLWKKVMKIHRKNKQTIC
ncbi:hypothetical protein LIER_38331 [Lithospermum erythrorhizon]|uniref:Uncharacterized protein n=1 Tax=Lithospermum erythrorhizon TaxID=34254 RepID=A0AAV3PYI7_LITER